ncbi:MAG: 3-keto-disaccharide hydrolase [Planctomycetota bacterium]|jgi:hypothetical protein
MKQSLFKRVTLIGLIIVPAIGMIGCNGMNYIDPDNAPKPREKDWIALCNGTDLTGWVQKDKKVPMSWKVVDGVMVNTISHGHHGTDIYTQQKFDDFEIYYEYRIPQGSNSGVYLRGRYELQIIDDVGWSRSKLRPNQRNGAIYSILAPLENVSRNPGQWQSVYAKLVGKKLTVVLNGKKIHDNAQLPRATAGGLDKNVGQPGPILIQGNHGSIDMRNIMIRPIKGCCLVK